MRKCPFHHCETRIGPSLFACKKHWYELSQSERDLLWAAYNHWRHGVIGLDELRATQQRILGRRGIVELPTEGPRAVASPRLPSVVQQS